MAYNKEDIYDESLKAIEENSLYFIEDVVAYLPCHKTTFYEMFPLESDEMNSIKRRLYDNKIKMKVQIRAKLAKGERAAELLSLYKLICTEEERQALSQSYQKIEGELKNSNSVELTDEQLNTVIESLKPGNEE